MTLSLMALSLYFTARLQSQGFVYPKGLLRYNRRNEIGMRTMDLRQISSLSGTLDSLRRLSGLVWRSVNLPATPLRTIGSP
jgi:hypothetical protein